MFSNSHNSLRTRPTSRSTTVNLSRNRFLFIPQEALYGLYPIRSESSQLPSSPGWRTITTSGCVRLKAPCMILGLAPEDPQHKITLKVSLCRPMLGFRPRADRSQDNCCVSSQESCNSFNTNCNISCINGMGSTLSRGVIRFIVCQSSYLGE